MMRVVGFYGTECVDIRKNFKFLSWLRWIDGVKERIREDQVGTRSGNFDDKLWDSLLNFNKN